MEKLNKVLDEVSNLYDQLYEYYTQHISEPENANLHKLFVLKNKFIEARREARLLCIDENGQIIDRDIFKNLVKTHGLMKQVDEFIVFKNLYTYYSQEELKNLIQEFEDTSNRLYDFCKNPITIDNETLLIELAYIFDQMQSELVFVFGGISPYLDTKITRFLDNFEALFGFEDDEVNIVKEGFFDDPDYNQFWNKLRDDAELDSDIVDSYLRTMPSGTQPFELYRFIPESVVQLFVNLCRVNNYLSYSTFSFQAILSSFENKEFAEYLRTKINEDLK